MYLTRGQAGWQLVGPPLCLQCRCSRPAASPQWLVAGGSWLSSDTCVLNGHWATRSCTGLREHELGRGGQARRSEGGQCLQGHSTAHRFVCFCLTLLETRGEWMRGARKEKEQRTEKWGKREGFIRIPVVALSVLRNVSCMATQAMILSSGVFPYGRNVLYGCECSCKFYDQTDLDC